ncbi:MAG TPA: hypothetical protein VME86_15945 [Acidobacteriaceae bacterium]|nr:hypothetical protein [Acidobacteriaceae bacterium]
MRFWIPTLGSLFTALFIVRFDPSPSGMMTGLLASLTGLDVASHLSK